MSPFVATGVCLLMILVCVGVEIYLISYHRKQPFLVGGVSLFFLVLFLLMNAWLVHLAGVAHGKGDLMAVHDYLFVAGEIFYPVIMFVFCAIVHFVAAVAQNGD